MKILTAITACLFALGLAVASVAQSQPKPATAPQPQTSAGPNAAVVLAHCDAQRTAPCGIDATVTPAQAAADSDPATLPANDAKHQQAIDPVTAVPEPQTFIMLMLGLVVLGFASRRNDASEKFSD